MKATANFTEDQEGIHIEKEDRDNPDKLLIFCLLFTIIVIIESITVITSPFLFVRVLNLVGTIVGLLAIGAFIREVFILRNSYVKGYCW